MFCVVLAHVVLSALHHFNEDKESTIYCDLNKSSNQINPIHQAKASCLSISIVILILSSDSLFGDDLNCIGFDF